jgi:anaerobic magnesium-protoporphyrin IX monomethyl ester cyclase
MPLMKKILLLNPPSLEVVLRDYFCSKVSQATYINPPVDFVCLSGRLAERFDVRLLDAVVERLSPEQCRARIRALAPDAVVALTGFVSWREDVRFFDTLDGLPLVLIGDILLENAEVRLAETRCAQAFLTDFSGDSLVRYLLGEREGLENMIWRDGDAVVSAPPASSEREFSFPVPRHELFLPLDYRYPFVLGRPFAVVLSEYGCPYKCDFCIMGPLGYKTRPVDNVAEELDALRRLGVRDLFFMDQTFASSRERARALLALLENGKPRFRWLCFSRVDRADADLLPLMKRAGCHTIIYGIESADDAILNEYKKGYTSAQVRDTFAAARKAGIRTVGTLIFGLPGDTPASCERTVALAKSMACDYISINIAVPRMGTPLRARAVRDGLVSGDLDVMDQSGTFIAMESGAFSADTLARLKRKAIRDFYLNAPYVLRRLGAVRSLSQLRIEARQAMALINNFMDR